MKLTWEALPLDLTQPFVSHKGHTESVRHVLVRIDWEGRVGRGVAVPARDYGTSESSVRSALAEYAPILADESPTSIERALRRLQAVAPGQAGALAAVDMALHDLLGQVAGLPVHRLLGLEGLPLPVTALSLGVMGANAAADRARALHAWPILKLKMSAPDHDLVRRVREVYPGRLWIDGNGGWTPGQAVDAAEKFHASGVELIEQPVPPGTPEALRFVHERTPMLVVADEDCVGPADVLRLAGCAGAINIKLLKCGGLRQAFEMILLARRAGLKVMLGCKTESVLGITAMAHLAPLADLLDLDGHLDIADDPFEGLVVDHGSVALPTSPGLGVTVRGVVPRQAPI